MKTKILFFIILIFSPITAISQLNCKKYHIKHCESRAPKDFVYYGYSRSTVMRKGMTTDRKILVYGGFDYYFAVCTHRKFEPLHFKIIDPATDEILYDNASQDYNDVAMTSNENTRWLIVRMTVSGNESETEWDDEMRCVGLLVMTRKTPRIGYLEKKDQ